VFGRKTPFNWLFYPGFRAGGGCLCIFDGAFQLARYPLGLYPGWLRPVLTWVIPVGVITTLPAEALTGTVPTSALAGSLTLSIALVAGSSALFRTALSRYASASN